MDFKKILLIACLFVGLNTFAQNRLEFNKVISLSGVINAGNPPVSVYTVPVGKILKITSFVRSSIYANISINSMVYANGVGVSNDSYHFPIWLKEGDVLEIKFTYSNSSSVYHISGIEFNIVQ